MDKKKRLTRIAILALLASASCSESGPTSPTPTTPTAPVVDTIPQVAGMYVGDLTKAHYPTGVTGRGTTGKKFKACQMLTQTGDQVTLQGWEVRTTVTTTGELIEPVGVNKEGPPMRFNGWTVRVHGQTLSINFERGREGFADTLHRRGEFQKQPEGKYECVGGAGLVLN